MKYDRYIEVQIWDDSIINDYKKQILTSYKIRAKFSVRSKGNFLFAKALDFYKLNLPTIRQVGRDKSIGLGIFALLRFIYLALPLEKLID